jgi:hypothetical protein
VKEISVRNARHPFSERFILSRQAHPNPPLKLVFLVSIRGSIETPNQMGLAGGTPALPGLGEFFLGGFGNLQFGRPNVFDLGCGGAIDVPILAIEVNGPLHVHHVL